MTAILTRPETTEVPSDPNPGIFMNIVPMEDVLNAESCDAYPGELMRDVLDSKILDDGFPALLESIRTHGLAKGYEPEYDSYAGHGYVSQGHHRIAALRELGAQWCPTNDGWDPREPWEAPDGSTPGACAYCSDCGRW